jgi:flagellar hook protein FlgE
MSLYGSLNSGVSALNAFTSGLEVISNNISNVNTTGFKANRAEYGDNFSQYLISQSNSQDSDQIGSGVSLMNVSSNWNQGDSDDTGVSSDLLISGNGFFKVTDPDSGVNYATRAGDFTTDSEGNLITSSGLYLQGTNTLGDGNNIQIPDSVGGVKVESYKFDETGALTLYLEDGRNEPGGQVTLYDFTNPYGLVNLGSGLYGGVNSAAVGAVTEGTAGSDGLGSIVAEALELSNVDLTEQFSNMIVTQRAFQGGSRVITTTDELMQEAINLKK